MGGGNGRGEPCNPPVDDHVLRSGRVVRGLDDQAIETKPRTRYLG